jgi:hypothetical protein
MVARDKSSVRASKEEEAQMVTGVWEFIAL